MATKGSPSAGLYNLKNKAPIVTKYSDLRKIDGGTKTFTITSANAGTWNFALLPSIEASLQFSPSGSLKGNISTPEAKPGIMSNTELKFKSFLVPGGKPAIQGIGIQGNTFQLTGLFIGGEGINTNPDLKGAYRTNITGSYENGNKGYTSSENAEQASKDFEDKIVMAMTPVTVEIVNDITYKFQGVITNYKRYVRAANKVYYVLNFLTTDY